MINQLTTILKLPLKFWKEFWFISGSSDALGLFRIGFGLFWLVRWLSYYPYVPLYFSNEGVLFPRFLNPESVGNFYQLMGFLTASPSVAQAWILYWVELFIIMMIILGLFTRMTLFLFLLLTLYHYDLYFYLYKTSYDRLLTLVIFFLFLGPCGKSFSFDCLRSTGSFWGKSEVVPLWTQRLICVQIAMVYFGTGVHKIKSSSWLNGDIVKTSLFGDHATELGFWVAQLGLSLGFYDLLTLSIIFFEVTMGFMLFHPRWQNFFFLFGFLFHLGNTALIWIPQFLSVPCSYILYLDPSSVSQWTRKQYERFFERK